LRRTARWSATRRNSRHRAICTPVLSTSLFSCFHPSEDGVASGVTGRTKRRDGTEYDGAQVLEARHLRSLSRRIRVHPPRRNRALVVRQRKIDGRANQLLRRVYNDLVKRRATTTISTAVHDVATPRPIFVIGVYRSGTTLLRYILDAHSNIACGPETDFVAHLADLASDRRSIAGLEGLGFDYQHVLNELSRTVQYFHTNYARAKGKSRWADKTPRYVEHIGFLYELFPDAQFVCIYRHPLDQIHSSTRGGTHRPWHLGESDAAASDLIADATAYWSSRVAQMITFEESFPDISHRIRYEDLCATPEAVVSDLFAYLEEPYEPGVLDLASHRHDVGLEDSKIRIRQRIELSSGHWKEWPQETIDFILSESERQRLDLAYLTQ